MKRLFCILSVYALILAACADHNDSVTSPNKITTQGVVDPSTVVKGTMTDSRDGQTYKTVTIGYQTWMAENLNFETDASFCYNNDSTNCAKYGRLYTSGAAMDSMGIWSTNSKGCGHHGRNCLITYPARGICPKGWHLPDSTEWEVLISAVGGRNEASKMLKSKIGWNEDGNGTDAYSFTALPTGFGVLNGTSEEEGNSTIFWSSSTDMIIENYYMSLFSHNFYAKLSATYVGYGFSVRCLKD